MAGLHRYYKIWNKFFKPIDALNCGIGGESAKCLMARVEFTDFFFLEKRRHFVRYQQFTTGFSREYC